jgi:ribosome-binding protein aMBF1 (putative translation factor)
MAKAYRSVVTKKSATKNASIKKFDATLRKQVKAEYQMTFMVGELIAQRREELKLSQSLLSEKTGLPQADISRIECGKSNPTLNTLEKILDVLQMRMTLTKK